MTAKLLHFQLRPWTPRRFADDVRQMLTGLTYQFPVFVEFFEDHNADQSARLAPTNDCGSNWLIMTADSRGIAVLSADATPMGVFRTGAELRTALLPVVATLAAQSIGPTPGRTARFQERQAESGGDQDRARAGLGQPIAFTPVAQRHGASAMDAASCSNTSMLIEEQSTSAMSLTANLHGTEHRANELCSTFEPPRSGPAPVGRR